MLDYGVLGSHSSFCSCSEFLGGGLRGFWEILGRVLWFRVELCVGRV